MAIASVTETLTTGASAVTLGCAGALSTGLKTSRRRSYSSNVMQLMVRFGLRSKPMLRLFLNKHFGKKADCMRPAASPIIATLA
jgi:hypothetical protein